MNIKTAISGALCAAAMIAAQAVSAAAGANALEELRRQAPDAQDQAGFQVSAPQQVVQNGYKMEFFEGCGIIHQSFMPKPSRDGAIELLKPCLKSLSFAYGVTFKPAAAEVDGVPAIRITLGDSDKAHAMLNQALQERGNKFLGHPVEIRRLGPCVSPGPGASLQELTDWIDCVPFPENLPGGRPDLLQQQGQKKADAAWAIGAIDLDAALDRAAIKTDLYFCAKLAQGETLSDGADKEIREGLKCGDIRDRALRLGVTEAEIAEVVARALAEVTEKEDRAALPRKARIECAIRVNGSLNTMAFGVRGLGTTGAGLLPLNSDPQKGPIEQGEANREIYALNDQGGDLRVADDRLVLVGDSDGFSYVKIVLFRDSGYTRGWASESGSEAPNWYTRDVFCAVRPL